MSDTQETVTLKDHPVPVATLTRVELAYAVMGVVPEVKLKDAHSLVSLVLSEVADALVRNEPVKLSSFGNFMVREKAERVGRNPKTGMEAMIPRMRVVTFKASNVLRDHVNESVVGSGRQGESHDEKGAP